MRILLPEDVELSLHLLSDILHLGFLHSLLVSSHTSRRMRLSLSISAALFGLAAFATASNVVELDDTNFDDVGGEFSF